MDQIEKGVARGSRIESLALLSEFGGLEEEGTVAVALSDAITKHGIHEIATPRDKLQNKSLPPLVYFFCIANTLLGVGIFTIALLELRLPADYQHIVTANVLIALITGYTAQGAAVIVQAFKGLFAHLPDPDGQHQPKKPAARRGASSPLTRSDS